MKKLFSKPAFTLAEVLITLGIIGVVAAMTIPNLILNYKAHRLKSQFNKSYSTIYQVVRRMIDDEVSFDNKDYAIQTFYKTFGNYLQGATDCGGQEYYSNPDYKGKPCFNHTKEAYKNLSGKQDASWINPILNDGEWLMPDGSLLLFENGGAYWNSFVYISVDLNGFGTPPDRLGVDLFMFQLIDGEIKAMGETGTRWCPDESTRSARCNFKNDSSGETNGICCAYYAKSDNDYFKKVLKAFK